MSRSSLQVALSVMVLLAVASATYAGVTMNVLKNAKADVDALEDDVAALVAGMHDLDVQLSACKHAAVCVSQSKYGLIQALKEMGKLDHSVAMTKALRQAEELCVAKRIAEED